MLLDFIFPPDSIEIGAPSLRCTSDVYDFTTKEFICG